MSNRPLKRVLRLTSCLFFLTSCFLLLASFSAPQQKEKKKKSKQSHEVKKAVAESTPKTHKVEKGQTLYAIAKQYNVTVNDLVVENPEAIDGIHPGQELKIPSKKAESLQAKDNKSGQQVGVVVKSDSANFVFHKVEQGQTLFAIAKKYIISEKVLIDNNPEVKKHGLQLGQFLKIPKKSSSQEVVVVVPQSDKPKEKLSVKEKAQIADQLSDNKIPTPIKEEVAESKNDKIADPVFKDSYNVALFLPFGLDNVSAIDPELIVRGQEQFPVKTELALSFYNGAIMAFDSLKKMGLNAKLYVYDMDDSDSGKSNNLQKHPELASMNLIIGPLYSNDFMDVAKFAKEHRIAIVSPLSQHNKILFNNDLVSKVAASAVTQTECMANYIAKRYKARNVIVVTKGGAKDSAYVATYRTCFKRVFKAKKIMAGDTLRELSFSSKGFDGLKAMLSLTDTNIVVVPSVNQVFVTDFVTRLNTFNDKDKYKIVLVGLPAWASFDNLDNEYLSKFNLHLPSNNFIDYEHEATKKFILNYRENYKCDPTNYAFQGFDVMYFYLNALKGNGTNFMDRLTSIHSTGLQAGFDFHQPVAGSGFENKHAFITKIEGFKYLKVE